MECQFNIHFRLEGLRGCSVTIPGKKKQLHLYHNVIIRDVRDLWQRKPPCPWAALGLGSVYCHKSQATGQ